MKKLSLVLGLFLLSVGAMMAQRAVSGTVSDPDGEGLIGASILVKGTATGTVTDVDGSFSINVPADAATLVVSYTGFATQEVKLGASNVLDIVLQASSLDLSEVVVTAIGLESNRRRLGYSVQNVQSEDIMDSQETNLVDGLNSKVAGVTVTSSSGSPGASSNIRIRGATSITGNNQPLFVVDGVPIDNSERGNGVDGVDQANRAIDINPSDIASMTVLKGPAATALYGVRAANGAIIITTKTGEKGKPKITFSSNYRIDQVNKSFDLQSTYAQGQPVGGVPTWRGPETAEGFSWGPAISDLEFDGSDYPYDRNGRLVPVGEGNGVPARAYDQNDFFVNGNTYDVNLSVQGGTEAVRYYISGGRLASQGVVPNSTFERTTIKVKTDASITEKLTLSASANFINSGGNRIQRGSNVKGVMLGLLRNTPTFDMGNGKTGQEAADDPSTYLLPDGRQRSYRAGIYDSPYWTANKNPFVDNVNRVIGYVGLNYELLPWLSLQYKLGLDQYSERRNWALDINPGRQAGEVHQRMITNRDLNSDLLLVIDKGLSDKIGLNAIVGHNYFTSKSVDQGSDGTTLAAPDFYHISNASNVQSFEFINERKLIGAFADVGLSYGEYLFVNLTGRNDWTSTLPKDNNTFQSWSASLGFAFTEALGMQNNPILPYGKLRLSYGAVGNDAQLYATQNYFNAAAATGDGFITGITFPAFGVNAFERDIQLGNDVLTPETTTTFEIGGEFKFLKGRLGLDITYYNSESVDQILPVELPAPTGFTTAILNAGVVTSEGVEILVDINPVRTKDFSWDITANFTHFENVVEELAEGIDDITLAGFVSTSSNAVAGLPFGALFGTGFQYDDAGNLLIDQNGWPLNDPIRRALGDPNPDFLLGLRNTFTYKGVRLSALFDIRQGGDVWCGTCGILNDFGTSQQSADERNDVVVFNGVLEDGTPNTIAVPLADPASGIGNYYRRRYGFGGNSEMNIFDASWVRLRELTLSYSLPSTLLGNTFENVSLSLTGRNLWLKTDFPGIDPETNLTGASNGFGLEYFNMPNTKSYAATLRATF